jgi:hypothetical protein
LDDEQITEGQRKKLLELGFGKRPAEELYDLGTAPGQSDNVADVPRYAKVKDKLSAALTAELIQRLLSNHSRQKAD